MPKTRTFLGIAASDEVIEAAKHAIARLQRVTDNVKWVEPANLHWTLHFLGELDDQEIYDVCQASERGASQVDAFGCAAQGLGAFPSSTRPRTLWIGAGQGGEQLVTLHAALDVELQPLGFRGENRRYVPHLTLGRAGRGLNPAESAALAKELLQLTDLAAGAQPVNEVLVYASRLRREGPGYLVLGRSPLG